MPKYGISAPDFTTSTSVTTALYLHANAAGERAEIVELTMTGSGTTAAADTQHRAIALPSTGGTAGTAGSNPTPTLFAGSGGSVAANCLAGAAYTAEPATYSTNTALVQFGFNQRGGMRWAVPQGEGVPINNAFTEKALGWRVISSAAGKVDANIHFWE